MKSNFARFAGFLGILAGFAGLAYLVLFIMLKNPAALPAALSLLLVGIFSTATITALYQRVRTTDEGFALWGLLLSIAGAGGAAVHAAFDLSENLHPSATQFAYPSPIDPRGFLTFAIAGIAVIVLAWLIVRGGTLSRRLGYWGIVSGILLIALYLAYLLTLNPLDPIVLALIVLSGLAQPIWYVWLGYSLWSESK